VDQLGHFSASFLTLSLLGCTASISERREARLKHRKVVVSFAVNMRLFQGGCVAALRHYNQVSACDGACHLLGEVWRSEWVFVADQNDGRYETTELVRQVF
jgi:hypothetical protein